MILAISGFQVKAIYENFFTDILESLGFDVTDSFEEDINENNSTITSE